MVEVDAFNFCLSDDEQLKQSVRLQDSYSDPCWKVASLK